MAGLRIATTTTVGLATLAFFAGAGGLGEQIFADMHFKSNVVVAGGLCVLLAVVLDADPADRPAAADAVDAGGGMTVASPFLGEFGDAIAFIFTERDESAAARRSAARSSCRCCWEHLKLVASSRWRSRASIALPIGLVARPHAARLVPRDQRLERRPRRAERRADRSSSSPSSASASST